MSEVRDEFDRVLDHLESKAPRVREISCASRTCEVYIAMMLMEVRKETGRVPPHVCIGIMGYREPDTNIEGEIRQARIRKAAELKRDYPDVFADML